MELHKIKIKEEQWRELQEGILSYHFTKEQNLKEGDLINFIVVNEMMNNPRFTDVVYKITKVESNLFGELTLINIKKMEVL